MMEDLAMHILEILMNSIKAGAKLITLKIRDSFNDDVIAFSIEDDGKGMDEEMVKLMQFNSYSQQCEKV